MADAFAVESDIAQRVVAAVGAVLTEAEASAIAAAPTRNAEAYRYYLQGLEYWKRPGGLRDNLEFAEQLYRRALDLDPGFAAAHASLSLVYGDIGDIYDNRYDPLPARQAAQLREAETALRLAPNLPLARIAMGAVDINRSDYEGALGEFMGALHSAPNDAQVWEWIGYANRHLGRWDQALVAADRAIRLDPRNVNLLYDLKGYTLGFIRRYPEAIAVFRQALALAPDLALPHLEIGWTLVRWRGEWDTVLAALAAVPLEFEPEARLWALLATGQPDSVLGVLRVLRSWAPEESGGIGTRETYSGWAHILRGDSAAARAAFDSAVVKLTALERARPGDWELHGARGIALACLGRRAEALREAHWIEMSDAYRHDRFGGVWAADWRAVILLWAGEMDSALAQYDRLLAGPGAATVRSLHDDFRLDPFRKDPRFQALLVKYANPGAP